MLWHDWYLLILIPGGLGILGGWVAMWGNWVLASKATPSRAIIFFGVGVGVPAAIAITVLIHFIGD